MASCVQRKIAVLVNSAERAEIIVDFSSKVGRFTLVSKAYERGWMGSNKPVAKALPLMTFELAAVVVKPIAIPEKLRGIVALGEPTASKRLEFSENMGMTNGAMTMKFLIDGKSFVMKRVDLKARVGEVELREIYNDSDMDHPLHIHGTQFKSSKARRRVRRLQCNFWPGKIRSTSQPWKLFASTCAIQPGPSHVSLSHPRT